MRSFAQKPKTRPTTSANSSILSLTHARQGHNPNSILNLQRMIDHHVLPRMLQSNAEERNAVLTSTAPLPHLGHDFSRISVGPPTTGTLQAKLAINNPGDDYEQEADHVAEQVMRMPEPTLQRACACGGACPKCKAEQLSQESKGLQTKRVRASNTVQVAAPPIVHDVLQSPGQPLQPATRAFMETRFGHDFSQVRVHSDTRAAASARAINAQAYTVGRDVVFGSDQYARGSTEGRRLLAHELTHVLQQRDQSAHAGEARRVIGVDDGNRQESSLIPVRETRHQVLFRKELIGEEQYTACTDPPYFWPQTCNGRENRRFAPEPVEVMTEQEWREHMRRHDYLRVRERTFLRAAYISDAEYQSHALANQSGFFDFTLVDHDVQASRRLDRVPTESEKLSFAKALVLRGGAQQHDWRYEQSLLARFIRDWQHRVVEGEARAGRIFTREQAELNIPESRSFLNPSAEPVGLAMIESASALLMRGLTLYIHAYGRSPNERGNANRIIQSAGNILRQGAETLDTISAEERQRVEAAINVLVDVYTLPGASDLSRVVRSAFKASVTPSIGGALSENDSAVDRMLRIQSGTIQFLEDFDYEGQGHSVDAGQDLKEHLQTMVRSLLQ